MQTYRTTIHITRSGQSGNYAPHVNEGTITMEYDHGQGWVLWDHEDSARQRLRAQYGWTDSDSMDMANYFSPHLKHFYRVSPGVFAFLIETPYCD